jgi:hypothetical protein
MAQCPLYKRWTNVGGIDSYANDILLGCLCWIVWVIELGAEVDLAKSTATRVISLKELLFQTGCRLTAQPNLGTLMPWSGREKSLRIQLPPRI